MEKDFVATLALTLAKFPKNTDDLNFLLIAKVKCNVIVEEFLTARSNEVLNELYRGYYLNETLIKSFRVKRWAYDDGSIVGVFSNKIKDIISRDLVKDVCKLFRMVYFQEFVMFNRLQDIHEILYLFFKIFKDDTCLDYNFDRERKSKWN